MTTAERLSMTAAARDLHARGVASHEAARQLGVSRAGYYRLLGGQGSEISNLKSQIKKGRPRACCLTEEERAVLRWHHGVNPSLPVAVARLLEHDCCTEATREWLMGLLEKEAAGRVPAGSTFPPSLRQAAHVDPALAAKLRGQKQSQNYTPTTRRGMTWEDKETGEVRQILANDVWESDDMSINKPYHWFDAAGRGMVARQSLVTSCRATARIQLVSLVGREADSYRAEDIARHLRSMVETYGLPLLWRVERGRWENNFIDGIPLDGLAKDHPWAAHLKGKRWGALTELFQVARAYTSKGKGGIESTFDLWQTLMDNPADGWLSLGRHRGEFEEANRQLRMAQEGKLEALAKFWNIRTALLGACKAAEEFNLRPKQRAAFGKRLVVPEEQYQEFAQPKRECPADQLWLLLPVKKLATVMAGVVTVTAPHYEKSFVFAVNGPHFAGYAPHGHKVLVAFDPASPKDGCHIFNADLGRGNVAGWNFGQPLCRAEMLVQDVPQFTLGGESARKGDAAKRGANAALASEYAAVARPGREARRLAKRQTQAGDSYEDGPRALAAISNLKSEISNPEGQGAQLIPFRQPQPHADAEADLAAALADL